jgi:hypothetical protein
MNHGQTWTHKTHHGSNLGEATTFPLLVFSVISHGGYIQMSFCLGTHKLGIPKIRTPDTLEGHNFLCRPLIEIIFEEKLYLLSRDFQRYVARHLYAHISRRFLTFNDWESKCPSFGHNLCFKHSNGTCEPILDIYVSRAF